MVKILAGTTVLFWLTFVTFNQLLTELRKYNFQLHKKDPINSFRF